MPQTPVFLSSSFRTRSKSTATLHMSSKIATTIFISVRTIISFAKVWIPKQLIRIMFSSSTIEKPSDQRIDHFLESGAVRCHLETLHHSIVNEMHEADLFLVVATFKHDLLALECTIEFMKIKQWNSGRGKRDLRK
jgi:hypothetical protein